MDRFARHFSPSLPKKCVRTKAENIYREFLVELNTFSENNLPITRIGTSTKILLARTPNWAAIGIKEFHSRSKAKDDRTFALA
jgi:hypothetical protein